MRKIVAITVRKFINALAKEIFDGLPYATADAGCAVVTDCAAADKGWIFIMK